MSTYVTFTRKVHITLTLMSHGSYTHLSYTGLTWAAQEPKPPLSFSGGGGGGGGGVGLTWVFWSYLLEFY